MLVSRERFVLLSAAASLSPFRAAAAAVAAAVVVVVAAAAAADAEGEGSGGRGGLLLTGGPLAGCKEYIKAASRWASRWH